MDFPPSFIINSTLEVGRVYKFSAPELIETDIPHFFVVIAIIGSDNYALVSTTKLQKRIDFLKSRQISLETLCYISPNGENGFTEDSYLDCNKYFAIPNGYLEQKVASGYFDVKGTISDEDFERIKYSITQSTLFDIPIELITK